MLANAMSHRTIAWKTPRDILILVKEELMVLLIFLINGASVIHLMNLSLEGHTSLQVSLL